MRSASDCQKRQGSKSAVRRIVRKEPKRGSFLVKSPARRRQMGAIGLHLPQLVEKTNRFFDKLRRAAHRAVRFAPYPRPRRRAT